MNDREAMILMRTAREQKQFGVAVELWMARNPGKAESDFLTAWAAGMMGLEKLRASNKQTLDNPFPAIKRAKDPWQPAEF